MLPKITLFIILAISFGCGIHLYDKSQAPEITVSSGHNPVISWTPPNAYQISIYKGSKAGDGSIGEIWNKGRRTGYENKLISPVNVSKALELGATYTVAIQRKDPKGEGDGFSNTRHLYIGYKTFVVH